MVSHVVIADDARGSALGVCGGDRALSVARSCSELARFSGSAGHCKQLARSTRDTSRQQQATSAQDRYRTDTLKKVVTLIEAIGSKESGTGGSNQGHDRQWELRRAGNL